LLILFPPVLLKILRLKDPRIVQLFTPLKSCIIVKRLESFETLVDKYSENQPEEARNKEISKCTQAHIIAIDVEHITGKEVIEFVKAKRE